VIQCGEAGFESPYIPRIFRTFFGNIIELFECFLDMNRAALYVLGMIATATMHGPVMLILGNVLVGIGLSAATFGPVLGVILRVAPPAKQALALRAAPGKRSNDVIRSRLTRVKDGKVLMTGQADNDQYYLPDSTGSQEDDDRNETTPGIQEDRDF